MLSHWFFHLAMTDPITDSSPVELFTLPSAEIIQRPSLLKPAIDKKQHTTRIYNESIKFSLDKIGTYSRLTSSLPTK